MHRLPDPREKPWLTVDELAEITGEGTKAIRAALAAGQLPCLEVGRYRRIPTAALLRLLAIDTTDQTVDDEPTAVTPLHSRSGPENARPGPGNAA